MKGKFIVFYGINNLGKTTQAEILVDKIKAEGKNAEYLKYPVYDLEPSGKILNNYLREGNRHDLGPREAQIIYTLNRMQYESELIKKLENGINIIAEDYTGTGLAWGIGADVDENFLKYANSSLLKEDVSFLFDGDRFMNSVEKNHRHEENDDLAIKVREIHKRLGEELGWIKINANDSIEKISAIIWESVKNNI